MRLPDRRVGAALAACLLALPAHAAQDPLERLNAAFADGRYEEALDAARSLADADLAAEWSSYLHSVAGDLPGALRCAREGLARSPAHAGLLTQALNASLTLGLAQGAPELSERLLAALSDADAARLAGAQELAARARELAQRDALAARSVARARNLVLAGVVAALLALVGLARSSSTS